MLTRPIGRGGMGTVWHARHPEGVDVAVKVVRPEYASQPEQAEAFRKEVRSVAFLDHPGIVRVYDFGVVPESVAGAGDDQLPSKALWLSMEFAEGGTLGDWPQITSWGELHRVLQQILRALAHGHARGIVHRDLKPRNVLVHPLDPERRTASDPELVGDVRVSLTDYGIAHALHREGADRAQAGTPGYMAPEQIRGDWRDLGPWTDLYSLGSLAWRLATGKSPFPGDRAPAVLFAQLHAKMRAFEPLLEVPPGFEDWIGQLLEVEPNRRYPCAADAAADLAALDRGGEIGRNVRRPALRDWREELSHETTSRPRGTGLALFVYRPWPLVGRTSIQDELWTAFRNVASTGRAQLLVLSGGPGVGKTRLATWLAERVEETGAAWTLRPPPERNMRPGRGTGAFGRPGVALPAAIRRLLRLEELAADDVHARLTTALADRGSPSPQAEASQFQEMLEQAFVLGQVAPRTLNPEDEANQVWLQMFDRLAHDRPLLLIVENLHAEPQAVSLLEAMISTRRPVLAVATVDQTAIPPHLAALRRTMERARVITVPPLDAARHREMVDAGVGLCPRLAEQVVERTVGDAGLAVRLVSDWVRRSVLVPTSTGFDLKDGADPRLSDALRDELASRLEGLGPARAESLVFLAALAPKRVRLDEWDAVCAAAKRPLRPETVDTLVARGLVSVEHTSDGDRLTFVPPALREAVLHRAAEQKVLERVHTLCAEVLVSQPRATAHERAVMHFHEAGLSDLALHHLRELIDRTREEAQWRRLPKLLAYERQLLDQLQVPESDSRWFRNQVDSILGAESAGEPADVAAARAVLARASNGDAATSARLARVIIRAEARAGTLRADDLLLLQAQRWAQTARDVSGQVELFHLAGEAAWRRLDVARADRLLSDAVALAEEPDERVSLLALLGEVRGLSGSNEQGAVMVARALEIALRSGSRRGMALALVAQSILMRYRGDLPNAFELARRAGAEFEQLGEDGARAQLQLGLAALGNRDFARARSSLAAVARGPDADRSVVAVAGLLGCAAADGSERAFDEAVAAWRTVADADRGYHPDTVWPIEWAATAAIEEGSVDRALTLLRFAATRHVHLKDPVAADRVERQRRSLTNSSPGR